MKDALSEALRRLPHGPEFRFIDRLVDLEPGIRGTAEYTVRGDEPFLKGHFPGQPMMPGVLLIEAIAQLAGTIAQSDPRHRPLSDLKLTAIRAAKVLGTAAPGDRIALSAEVEGRLGSLVQARGSVEVGGNLIAQAEVVLAGDVD